MFKLEPKCVPSWPKLAWVAVVENGSARVEIYHGPMVEISDEWIAEAVWAGDFAAGNFDQTDLVFGSGIKVRQNRVTFISAATVFDRIWHVQHQNQRVVSNTLPGLLAGTGMRTRKTARGMGAEGPARTCYGYTTIS